MLKIRLNKKATASDSGGGAKLASGETVTVACPDHLVLAELPVAKSLGSSASGVTLVKTVGHKTRGGLGERVHFCLQCDFPIAIYGRLIPCEHIFCLDCARSNSICYMCDERIQKIQTIKMMEGVFICGAPQCYISFLKKTDFEAHVHAVHADLMSSNPQKDGIESEAPSIKKPTTSDSTVQAPTPTPALDVEDRTQQRSQPPLRLLLQPNPDTPHVYDGPTPTHILQPSFECPVNALQSPGFVVPVDPNVGPNVEAPFDPSMMNQGGFFPGAPAPIAQQGGNGKDGRAGILAADPPPPPPMPFTQMPGNFHGGD